MKRVHSALLLASLVLCTACSGLKASLDFGSKNAKISIASGGKLNVTSSNMSVDGTLELLTGASASGELVNFDRGVLSSGGLDGSLTGSFDPATQAINLVGNSNFDVQPGTVVQSINIRGTNSLSGQPSFASPIVLQDSDAQLNIDVQSVIDQDIMLHSGAIVLYDNLTLGDNVRLVGDADHE